MGIWKAIKRTVGVGLLAATMGCSAPNTVGPVESRSVNFNKTLFANQGVLYRPTITGSYDDMKWKIGNGTQVTGVDVYANDDGHGDLEVKLFKAGKECDSVSVDENRVYKGEVTTDGELKTIVDQKETEVKLVGIPDYNHDPGNGYIYDSVFVKIGGDIFYIWAIGNNSEESYQNAKTAAEVTPIDHFVLINPGESIADAINSVVP